MIEVINGDIFETDANIILHQVNCQGVMGSGVAKQVREKYPIVFEYYKAWCDDITLNPIIEGKHGLLGSIQTVYYVENNRCIVNLFAQDQFGYDGRCYTDYDALKRCLQQVNNEFKDEFVAIPYLMGCHRGGGDWNLVSKMIEETLVDCTPIFYKWSE